MVLTQLHSVGGLQVFEAQLLQGDVQQVISTVTECNRNILLTMSLLRTPIKTGDAQSPSDNAMDAEDFTDAENGDATLCNLCSLDLGVEIGSKCGGCHHFYHDVCLNPKMTDKIAEFVRGCGFDFLQLRCRQCLTPAGDDTGDDDKDKDVIMVEDDEASQKISAVEDSSGSVDGGSGSAEVVKIDYCPECKSEAGKDTAQCDFCDSWFHIKCVDSNMSKQIFNKLHLLESVLLKCPPGLAGLGPNRGPRLWIDRDQLPWTETETFLKSILIWVIFG